MNNIQNHKLQTSIKRRWILFSLLLVTCCLLSAGCSNPMSDEQDDKGSIVINLGGGTARTIGWGGALDTSGFGITYEIDLVGAATGSDFRESIPVSGNTASKSGITPGDYKVEVSAYVNGWDYAYCLTAPFTVTAGQTTQVEAKMQRVDTAVVLSVPRGTALDFGTAGIGTTSISKSVTVYNFTDNPVNINLGSPPAAGLSWTAASISIPKDSASSPIAISTVTTTKGVHDTSLTLTYGNPPQSAPLDLKFTVQSANGEIWDQDDLEMIASNLSGTYTLKANITLTGNWTPVGTSAAPFTGTFDGSGHTISGLNINTSADHQGLFGEISGGTVKNLGLTVNIISTDEYVGGVAGYNNNATIQNCYVTGVLQGYDRVGGIVGASSGAIENCYSTADVTATDQYGTAGGIIGRSGGTVNNCYATGVITGVSSYPSGGLVGFSSPSSSITNSIALNSSLTGSSSESGRVAGYQGSPGTFASNYARVDMMVNGSPLNPGDGNDTNKDGRDVSSGTMNTYEYNNQTFWSNDLGWPFGSNESAPWKMTTGTGNLPKLWFE